MSDNPLTILISAALDKNKAEKSINDSIRALANSPSLQKLELKINIDKSFLTNITSLSKSLDLITSQLKKQSTANNSVNEGLKNTTNSIQNQTKATNEAIAAEKKWQVEREKTNSKGIRTVTSGNNVDNQKQTQSLINSAFSGKQTINSASSGVADAKALEVLNRQYDKVLANLNTVKNSGKQLTDSELSGINRRIEALNNLAARQKQNEKDQVQLLSTQLRAETQVNNLISKYGSNIDSSKLHQLLTELKALDTTSTHFKNRATQLAAEINQIGLAARGTTAHTNGMSTSLKDAFKNITMYAGIGSIFYGSINLLREMTSTIIEVDTQLTQLKRVMDEETNFNNILQSNMDMAERYGLSLKSVMDTTIEFGRMGFDENQINTLTKAATLAQNISEMSAKESVDAIVSSMTNFNITAEDSISIVDQLNEVDNSFSTTSKDLSVSLTKSAATAYTFGRSMQGILGDTTAIQQSTRETGSVVGNALKSIYSRLTTMDKSEGLLKDVGVAMHDLSGEVKTTDQLLSELAANWNTLSREQQENTAVGLAGRNHMTRFIALMSNWDVSVRASETALNSQGSAMEENQKRIGSLEARIERMKAVWQSFAVTMGDKVISDSIVLITSLISGLGKWFTFLVDKIGGLPTLFSTLSVALYLGSAAFKSFSLSIVSSIANMMGIVPAAAVSSSGLRGVGAAATVAKVGLRGLLASTVIGLVFVGIGAAAEALINHFSKTNSATEDLTTSLEDLDAKSAQLTNLKKLSSDYEELAKKTKLTADEKMRLSKAETELQNTYGISLSAIESQSGAVDRNTEAIKGRITALQTEISLQRESAILTYQADQLETNKKIEEETAKVNALRKTYEDAQTKQSDFFNNVNTKTPMSNENGQWSKDYRYDIGLNPNLESNAKGIEMMGQHLATATKNASKAFSDANATLMESVNEKTQGLKGIFANYIDSLEENGTQISAQSRQFADIYASMMAGTSESDTTIFTNFQAAFDTLQKTKPQNLDQLVAVFESLPGAVKLTTDQINSLQLILSAGFGGGSDLEGVADSADDATEEIISLAEAFEILERGANSSSEEMDKFYKSLSNGKTEIELLNSAQTELKENGYLSIETMGKLSSTFDDFSAHISDSKESLLKYMAVQEQDRVSAITTQRDKTKALIEATKLRIAVMETEMQTISKLTSSYADAVASGAMSDLEAERMIGSRRKFANDQSVQEEKARLNSLSDQLSLLDYVEKDYKASGSSEKENKEKNSNSDSDKDLAEFKDATEQRINTINALAEAQATLNEAYSTSSSSAGSNGKYAEAITYQNKLIAGQVAHVNKLSDANKKLYTERSIFQSKNKTYDMSSWVDTNGEATESFVKLYNGMGTKTAQESLQSLFDKYQMLTQAITTNNDTIRTTTANQVESSVQLRELYFSQSEKFITDESEKMRQSGKSELEIAQMVMEARVRMATEQWTTTRNIAKLSADEQIEANKNVYDSTEDYVQKYIDAAKSSISDIGYEISLSQSKMEGFAEGSADYNAELKTQISLTEKQISANQSLITYLEKQLKNENLDAEAKASLKEQIKELVLANYEYGNSIKDINENLKDLRETAADNIIDELKAVIEEERDLKLDAIEDLMDAEDERHEKRIANIEEEQEQFEDYINAQIDALDKTAAEEDYAKELASKQADRQKIVDQLNTLSLDNSASAKKKKAELTEQLADIDEEIAEYQTDRERTLRKEALQQQLEDRSDYTDELTDIENEYSETITDSLEDQKDATEQAYEDILDNTEYFYNLKQKLLSDNTEVTKAAIDEIQTKYGTYFTTLQNHAFTTNQAFENLNYTLKQSLANLEKYSNGDYSESSSSTSSSSSGSSSTSDSSTSSNSSTLSAKQIAWQDYLNNKQKAEQLVAEMKKLTPDSADYASKLAQYKVLNAANITYRKQYTDFPDGSYAQLKDKVMSAETGGLTSSWGSDGKFALLHEKELVLNKSDTSNLLDTVSVVRDIMSNFKSSFSSGTVNTSSTSTASSTVDNSITIENVTIQANDTDTGQSLLDKFSSALNNNLKLRTV